MHLALIDISVLLVATGIIVTKFMDCWTTYTGIRNPIQERNPFARQLMQKYGIKNVVWIIFLVSILLVGGALVLLYNYYNSFLYKLSFIFLGILISITQFAVALSNKTGRPNFITKLLLRFYAQIH